MSYDIEIEQVYEFPIETVWKSLTDSELLADWLMPNDFKPVAGHKFKFTSKPMPGWRGFVECEVLTIEPPHKLEFTWLGDDDRSRITTVTFELKSEGESTRLTFRHTGFKDAWGKEDSQILRGGWQGIITKKLLASLQGAKK